MQEIPRKVLTREDLKHWCDELKFHPKSETIDPTEVPEHLSMLIPYAEIWGQRDEDRRNDVRRKTPPILRQHLIDAIYLSGIDRVLNDWFALRRASGPPFADAYISFLCLFPSIAEF